MLKSKPSLLFLVIVSLIFAGGCQKSEAPAVPGATALPVVTSLPAYPYPLVEEITENPAAQIPSEPYPQPVDVDPLVDPHIEIDLPVTLYKVGDTITIVGTVVDIGLPYFSIIVRDEGVQDNPPMAEITYENKLTLMDGTSSILELKSASASNDQITLVFLAKKAGKTTVMINATGEVHQAYPGPAMWQGGSGEVVIVVEE